jgi:hypothetical protein
VELAFWVPFRFATVHSTGRIEAATRVTTGQNCSPHSKYKSLHSPLTCISSTTRSSINSSSSCLQLQVRI